MVERRRCAIGPALVMAALLASGCAAGGPVEAPGDGASPPPAPITFAASDGSAVAAEVWAAEAPKATFVALHGYGDHGRSTFRRAAAFWQDRGLTTIAVDQRGFGRNPSRGHWPGADAMIADAAGFVAAARERDPCVPTVLLGHSMGGGIALAAAGGGLGGGRDNGLGIDGLILATPAIWGGAQMNPLHRAAAWLAAAVVPDRRFSGRGVVRIQASDNIEMLRELGRDPLYLSPPSPREIMGLVRITDRAQAAAPKVRVPALMLLGSKDQIVPNKTVRAVFATTNGPQKVIEYPEGWHLVFRDLQAERVWTDVADWIDALPARACAPGVSG